MHVLANGQFIQTTEMYARKIDIRTEEGQTCEILGTQKVVTGHWSPS